MIRAAVWALLLACATALGAAATLGAGAWVGPAAGRTGGVAPGEPMGSSSFAVGEIVVAYTDPSRRLRLPGGRRVARTLVTVIRYPAEGNPARVDVRGAPPARARGPFPLIVFGHGFGVTPAPYAPLLRAWARAGYVVAAPIFPLTNANAPGGPDESDLVNQPTDMSFVITRMLAASAKPRGILAGLIDPAAVAVSGQSDGGSTALAAAYNSHYLDHRIGAAVILAGARIPGVHGYDFAAPGPPLLAVQGTADVVNVPKSTSIYYRRARAPKFLLSLLGAGHFAPYTDEQPQLGIVERVSTAFLNRYLKRLPAARAQMREAGNVPHVARLRTGR